MADTLSAAKGALEHAKKAFPAAPDSDSAAKNQTNASYSLVGAMKKKLQEPIDEYHKTVKDVEAPGIAQGVESRNKNLKDAEK